MAVHKLDLGEFDEIDYHLIAIHTSLEDYRLAYFINQKLPINLGKSKNEIQINIKEGETKFSRFYYHDVEKIKVVSMAETFAAIIRKVYNYQPISTEFIF